MAVFLLGEFLRKQRKFAGFPENFTWKTSTFCCASGNAVTTTQNRKSPILVGNDQAVSGFSMRQLNFNG